MVDWHEGPIGNCSYSPYPLAPFTESSPSHLEALSIVWGKIHSYALHIYSKASSKGTSKYCRQSNRQAEHSYVSILVNCTEHTRVNRFKTRFVFIHQNRFPLKWCDSFEAFGLSLRSIDFGCFWSTQSSVALNAPIYCSMVPRDDKVIASTDLSLLPLARLKLVVKKPFMSWTSDGSAEQTTWASARSRKI